MGRRGPGAAAPARRSGPVRQARQGLLAALEQLSEDGRVERKTLEKLDSVLEERVDPAILDAEQPDSQRVRLALAFVLHELRSSLDGLIRAIGGSADGRAGG